LQLDGGVIVVNLIDPDSAEFDVTEFDKVDTTSALDQRVAGGLGIYLVKKMVDDVKYHHSDRTSTVVLTKKMGR
ncbi:MAG: ATP-binding protein, partial [Rhodothermales bacterium]|nr:ATP-binding protein [Rhodothermales bacterium]